MPEVIATPFSSLIARDGRPFGFGGKARGESWLSPSVFAGSFRTAVAKKLGWSFDDSNVLDRLKSISTSGALPYLPSEGVLYFPKPFDCVVGQADGKRRPFVVRPETLDPDKEGVDLPFPIRPALLRDGGASAFKPVATAPFWSFDKMIKWLETEDLTGIVSVDAFPQLKESVSYKAGLEPFPKDVRVGVGLDPQSGTAKEGLLYSVTGLDLFNSETQSSLALYSRTNSDFLAPGDSMLGTLGGKRRLATWKILDASTDRFAAPKSLLEKARSARRVRMVLTSPAIFSNGSLPGWLNDDLVGSPPSCPSVTLRLDSIAADRWAPVSGWSYEYNRPKPVRRTLPAGSVYFFLVESGNPEELFLQGWFKSVSDSETDRLDGFGVAVWGVY